MEFLIDPNVAYIVIVAAVMLSLITILVPGTGLPEIGLILCLLAAWYELSRFEPNPWALGVAALSPLPFLAATRQSRLRLPLLTLSFLMLVAGSIFMFIDPQGRPTVNFPLAGVVSTLCALFIWIAVERGLKAQDLKLGINPDNLVGAHGEARTEIFTSGSVQACGELWSAHSDTPIPAGSTVVILRRDGFVLTVMKTE